MCFIQPKKQAHISRDLRLGLDLFWRCLYLPTGKTGDSSDQSPVTNQYEASPDANVYGTQNTYSTGVTYGSTQPLYGNQNGMSSAPSNYPYSAGAYGANPCGCNQMPQGGAYSQPNSVQGSKLQRNQDAMGGRSSQSNQGYSVVQPNAHYPAYPVPYSPPAPVYSGPVMNYGYQQYNPYNYPYSTYPYGYYGYPAYPHHHQQKASQHKKRSGRRTKKHRVKKQHSDKPSDKHRDGQRENFRNDERMNEKMDDSKESDM